VSWLPLVGLGIMWAACLVPRRRKGSEARTVRDFEHRMELLASAEVHGTQGRWIVTPRKGVRFLGPKERHRARARERRRRVFVFLLESIGITFLIGLVPPLRVMWWVMAGFAGALFVYAWLLVTIKQRAADPRERIRAAAAAPAEATRRTAGSRYVAQGRRSFARPTFNGLGGLVEGDSVHVVVRPASASA
jgi:Flp pilus assembly protein TadB